jgi:alpha-glucosidase
MGQEWWRGAAIYQIYPRSFADSNADGIGDLAGIAARLEHIASLGVDAIWLSPFFESPMKDFGYDVSNYCEVDPIFGTLADFDLVVARAHELGLRVIIDQVFSHTSDQHAWFRESRSSRDNPRADWYVWADPMPDGSPPSNWQSVFGGPAWAWDARRGQYYLHNFLSEQPDLNVHNPAVQDALLECGRFWLERGVDGFRVDAIDYAMHDPALTDNPPAISNGKQRTRPLDFQEARYNKSHADIVRFIERIRALADSYGSRFTVAEVGGEGGEPTMKRFISGDKLFHTAYGFNFLYAESVSPALIRSVLESWPDDGTTGWPSWAFSNHDAPRAVSRWVSAADREIGAQLAMLLLISLRGNIFLYQGEELGLPQAQIAFEDLRDPEAIANWPLTLGRDGARTPLPWIAEAANAGFSQRQPWLPVPQEHRSLAVDLQNANPDSQLAITRRFIALRNSSPALRIGSLKVVEATDSLLAIERRHRDDRLLCVFNFGATAQTPRFAQKWRILESVGAAGTWQLPPLSGLIAQQL